MKTSLLQIVKIMGILIAIYMIESEAQSCTGSLNGHNYDFTPLKNDLFDYNMTGASGANLFLVRINMCRPLVNLGSPACLPGSSGCQLWDLPNPNHKSTLGLASTMTILPLQIGGRGYTANFTGGVSWSGSPVQSQINFICDQSAGNGGPIITSTSGNDFRFTWNTAVACTAAPSGGGGSKGGITGGGIFLIILFCGAAVYVVAGVLVNKFVRNQSGIEILPNVAFWGGFFGLIKDGGRFIMIKTCRRGGYTQV